MTDGLLKELQAAFRPELFVNHYGSSEIYTFTIDQNAPAKPGSAGRAGINELIRVVRLGAASPDNVAEPNEEGEIIAHLSSDEAFEGYWQRPDADAKALRHGWYFTGDTGYFDADGDLFVTGRVDDMIITGGENVSRSRSKAACRSPGGVGGRGGRPCRTSAGADRGSLRQAPLACSIGRARSVCRTSGLANFKRPRR